MTMVFCFFLFFFRFVSILVVVSFALNAFLAVYFLFCRYERISFPRPTHQQTEGGEQVDVVDVCVGVSKRERERERETWQKKRGKNTKRKSNEGEEEMEEEEKENGGWRKGGGARGSMNE